jgi:hypothetical protein
MRVDYSDGARRVARGEQRSGDGKAKHRVSAPR